MELEYFDLETIYDLWRMELGYFGLGGKESWLLYICRKSLETIKDLWLMELEYFVSGGKDPGLS